MIVAVDFDGTIVTHEYPKIGKPVPFALETLKLLQERGDKIMLWTMRSDEFLDQAVSYLLENGIHPWGVNENPEQMSWTESNKQYAHKYIDDAALGCPVLQSASGGRPYVDWTRIARYLGVEL